KNGVVSEHAACSDNFGKSSGTDLEECCCYGDGCNGSDVDEPLRDFADGEWYASIPPLRCYQFDRNASTPLNGLEPTLCAPGSRACSEYLSSMRAVVYHSCRLEACNDANLEHTTGPVCINRTLGALTAQSCCCSSDGCNKRLGNPLDTKPGRQTLASRIAERIERFYDKDAASSERAFIRQVVKHVHENIDRD
ncbi:hypothetical protein AAVH_25219, partial [Aphelenchoides avenae]